MGKATERLFLPLLRHVLARNAATITCPRRACSTTWCIVKIKKRYPGHARKVMYGIWGLGLLMLAKAIVVVDEWVDVHNLSQVAWQALGNVDWAAISCGEKARWITWTTPPTGISSAARSAWTPRPRVLTKATRAAGRK